MKTQQRVVETFDRENIPPPHASKPDGTGLSCKTLLANAVAYLECGCGYKGFANVIGDKVVCPAHLARVEQHKRETNQTLAETVASPNIDAIVNAAVEKALRQAKGGN